MGVFFNNIDRKDLKPGDHIYSWRQAYIYAHHGIYIGDGMVIHFTSGEGQEIGTGTLLDRISFSSSFPVHPSDNPCPQCGPYSGSDGVITSCFDCFLVGGDLYLFEYGVSLASYLAKPRGGTCTLAPSDPPEDVLRRATLLLQKGFGGYHVYKKNCEDFAIYCKTGRLIVNTTSNSLGSSGQTTSVMAALDAIASAASFLRSVTKFSGLAAGISGAVGYSIYCVKRVASDIGVRRDVVKVPVEILVANTSLDESSAATDITLWALTHLGDKVSSQSS